MDLKTDSFNLMFGDCLERMKELPDNSVDLILTDPPYGTIKTISKGSMSGSDWDKPLDTKLMMKECHRILRPKGTMCLFLKTLIPLKLSPMTTGTYRLLIGTCGRRTILLTL